VSRACLTPAFLLSDGCAAAGLGGTLVQRVLGSTPTIAMKDALRQPVIFDGRNLYDPAIRNQGFEYFAIGADGESKPCATASDAPR